MGCKLESDPLGTVNSHWRDDNSCPLKTDDDHPGDKGKTTEQKIYDAVGALVEALPGLWELQLGDYKQAVIPDYDLQWGSSRRWMEVVKARLETSEVVVTGNGDDEQREEDLNRGFRGHECRYIRCQSVAYGRSRKQAKTPNR